ncbi:MAG: acyl carrier protein [Thermomicrobiales bacterium]|jgi:acyl carrier protein|nr:acyl carrier protein [Thermomicrobiales bacterium]
MAQTEQFTFDDLKEILVDRIGLSEDQVVNDPNLAFEDMGLDSLAFVEIQLAVQQKYGFSIPDEDAHEITTIGQAIDYTNRRLQEQG